MRIADDRGFRHFRVGDERALDFGRAHPVTGHIDDVVDAPGDPVVAVRVAARAVAGEVLAGIGGEICVHEASVVAEHGARLTRPGVGDDQVALARAFLNLALGVDDLRNDAKEGSCRRPGFELGRSGQWGNENAAGLGLPPGVDDRAAAIADDAVIPFPGFRIDGLADRTQKTKRGAARFLHRLLARAHQRPDGGRRGIEGVDLVLVDDLPEPAHRRIVGNALEHERRRAVGQRPVENVAVAGHPADIGRAPIDVAIMIVEDILMGHRDVDEIASGRVQNALRRARRT